MTVKRHKSSIASSTSSLLYIFFEGPNSYTGEDVLELYPHGNPIIVRELIQVIKSVDGVRLAEPGEYTRRAFLNGRMDLVQAESVADVIHSANRDELRNAHRLLGGALSKKVKTLTEQVMDISAHLELDVDFSEEEADPDYATWGVKISAIRESVESILKSFKGKAAVSRLPLAVLYGAPNAGKSSLVNALLGEDRILVSNIPGTTRDFVEVRLFLDGGEIRLVDTAGIADKATDALDALSMEKSKEILAEADMKILVVDGSLDERLETRDESCMSCHPERNEVESKDLHPDFVVISKSDLLDERRETRDERGDSIHISSKTGEGLAELKRAMNAALFKKTENSEDLWITSEREKTCLEEALAGIDRALTFAPEHNGRNLVRRRFTTNICGVLHWEIVTLVSFLPSLRSALTWSLSRLGPSSHRGRTSPAWPWACSSGSFASLLRRTRSAFCR